jgi:hypothetical protein
LLDAALAWKLFSGLPSDEKQRIVAWVLEQAIKKEPSMIAWLQGKKTYIICGLAILGAVAGRIFGDVSTNEMVGAIMAALGAMSLGAKADRNAKVANIEATDARNNSQNPDA